MFRLERVEIAGFKSFYEKVDLAFPGRVTAVVGPNGCGKSNICDAVAWALGEQSARVLRGERMDDVIFNGSARRRPVGMAEVTLTLTRKGPNGDGEGEDSESLRIGRRVYREGHGEYFLNDRQVRLKDIQDQLLGTGLGVRAYSVIEQGRIDQVLSTKPQDRRRLIEEAAGITRYKLKKRLAEVKLEETRGNLLRLSDIISEIERNVASLKRQASRAARYKEQSQRLREKRSTLLRARYDRLVDGLAAATRARDERRDREAETAAALARAEAELAQARLASSEKSAERDKARDLVSALELAIERDEAVIQGNRRAAGDLEARREALERERVDFGQERDRALHEIEELRQRLERAVAEARARSLDREEADRKASAAAAALARLEQSLEQARAENLAAAGERVGAGNARHETDLAAERVAASLLRLEEAAARVAGSFAEREGDVGAAQSEHDRLAAEAAAAAAAVEACESDLARLSADLEAADRDHQSAREALRELEHRMAALEEISRAREVTVEEVRNALSTSGISSRHRLSDRLEPRPGWEDAVDAALGGDADALLVEGDVARAISATAGLPSTRLVAAGWTPASPARDDGAGWSSILSNFERLTAAERGALPPAVFVHNLAEAVAQSREHPQTTFVTRNREIVRGSLLQAVRAASSGLFAAARDRAGLEPPLKAARERLREAEDRSARLRRDRELKGAEAPARRETEKGHAAALSAFAGRLEERRTERDRLRREAETLSTEADALRQEAASLAARRAAVEQEEERCARREAETRERADALSAQLAEARSFAMASTEELAHRRTEAEVAAERRRALETAREKLLELQGTLDRRLGELGEEERRLSERKLELAREEKEARERQAVNVNGRR
ncbi:MAG TPA: AAA family ATPase, partial [Thermoanaerobaculia bacterium]|nr:AAA family ATPase [Thermoanaerobaculia bacterium]